MVVVVGCCACLVATALVAMVIFAETGVPHLEWDNAGQATDI